MLTGKTESTIEAQEAVACVIFYRSSGLCTNAFYFTTLQRTSFT